MKIVNDSVGLSTNMEELFWRFNLDFKIAITLALNGEIGTALKACEEWRCEPRLDGNRLALVNLLIAVILYPSSHPVAVQNCLRETRQVKRRSYGQDVVYADIIEGMARDLLHGPALTPQARLSKLCNLRDYGVINYLRPDRNALYNFNHHKAEESRNVNVTRNEPPVVSASNQPFFNKVLSFFKSQENVAKSKKETSYGGEYEVVKRGLELAVREQEATTKEEMLAKREQEIVNREKAVAIREQEAFQREQDLLDRERGLGIREADLARETDLGKEAPKDSLSCNHIGTAAT